MTSTSTADVVTERPGRFAKQLVSHLGRHNGGEWSDDERRGWIQLRTGRASLAAEDGVLRLEVEGDDDSLEQLEDVVGRHLVRFATQEELVVSWTRADGTPGTEQRAVADPA